MTWTVEQSYDEFPRIEEEFQLALDESLGPRGPESLFDIAAGLGLPAGAETLDLGCGEGEKAIELARRFGFRVHGIDPVARNIEVASEALDEAAKEKPELCELVRFQRGAAESVPAEDASFDLVWCNEVLCLIEDLDAPLAECRRVLRPGGRMLVHQMFSTERLEPREAEQFWGPVFAHTASTDAKRMEAAFSKAGLGIEQCIVMGGEWGEYAQERSGAGGRRAVHTARLLRDPERYIARFGRANYDIMLADCRWHVYRLIGKIEGRVYVLRAG
jgi:ubiquinone/menaquinone biosynthesis C-methylase UbiE